MRKGAATAAAAGAGAAWAEDALAPSLGQEAQQHPAPDRPREGGSCFAVGGLAAR